MMDNDIYTDESGKARMSFLYKRAIEKVGTNVIVKLRPSINTGNTINDIR